MQIQSSHKSRYNNFFFDINIDLKKLKAFIAAFLGTVVENYDYALYGYLGVILAAKFFPETSDPSVALMRQFGVFALGFLAQPLGSYIFGSIGDKYGRKHALRWSIIGIALPTTIIGCLPDYSKLGWIATAILLICRISQGVFISAEGDGVEIFVYETISKRWACLGNSLVVVSYRIGFSLASFLSGFVLSNRFAHLEWAWRIPFFIGGALGLFTLWFRVNLIESYDYILNRVNAKSKIPDSYLKTIWENKGQVFVTFIIAGCFGGTAVFYLTFWNNYLNQTLNLFSTSEACYRTSFLTLMYIFFVPMGAFICDQVRSLIPPLRIATVLLFCMVIANAWCIHYYNYISTSLMACTIFAMAFFHAPIYILLMRLFDVSVRYRCLSIGHAFGSIIISSTTPLVSTYFWQKLQMPAAPLLYCASLVFTCFIAINFAKPKLPEVIDYHKKDKLTEEELEDFLESEPMISVVCSGEKEIL
jgi:MHS family proline/betaine transporter-like MFS transporter